MKCKICNPAYSENLRLKGEVSTFSNFQFIPRLLLLATLNRKCGQEITWMKRKKDGKQAIDNSCWNSKKRSLKRKNKYRVSQNLQPNQKCLKTAMWWIDSTPCFSGAEGILSSHSIRSGILAELLQLLIFGEVWNSYLISWQNTSENHLMLTSVSSWREKKLAYLWPVSYMLGQRAKKLWKVLEMTKSLPLTKYPCISIICFPYFLFSPLSLSQPDFNLYRLISILGPMFTYL